MNENDVEVSRDIVGFVGADRPRFADETAALIRRRLVAVSLIISIVLAAAFLGNLLLPNVPLLKVRAIVLLIFVTSYLVLRSRVTLSAFQLRVFELVDFGALAIHLLLMMYLRVATFALSGDAASAISAQQQFLCACSVSILTYGIFMPNTWKRAALVLVPAASAPYIVLGILRSRVVEVTAALDSSNIMSPVPMPFVAAIIAIFGTHIINSVRRSEFKARQLGQYHLKEKLGIGGMGVVYEAEHRMLKRPCAIKLIKPESDADTKAIEQFEREVRSTAKLSHWNTVEIFDYGHTEDGTFYYVMELLPGLSLEELVERHGPMPAARAVRLLRQTCCALREAHAAGLIHRDIKPANIFAARRGGITDVAKLLDFGLVRQTVEDSDDTQSDKPGKGFSGSPAYMAPEQSVDFDKTDGRSDIYALGAVAYYMITGRPPFTGKNAFEVLRAHHTRAIVPPSQVNPSIPADVEQVLLRCLAKEAKDRYQSAEALEEALASCECADAWTDKIAASWWLEHEPRNSVQHSRKNADASDTEAVISATVEVQTPPDAD